MPEVCAAMGLTSLEAMEEIVRLNRRNHECYRDGLQGLAGISLVIYDPHERNSYQYVVVEVDPEVSPLNRDELVALLHAENVLARKYFWPGCHQMEPYKSAQRNVTQLLPHTESVAGRILIL